MTKNICTPLQRAKFYKKNHNNCPHQIFISILSTLVCQKNLSVIVGAKRPVNRIVQFTQNNGKTQKTFKLLSLFAWHLCRWCCSLCIERHPRVIRHHECQAIKKQRCENLTEKKLFRGVAWNWTSRAELFFCACSSWLVMKKNAAKDFDGDDTSKKMSKHASHYPLVASFWSIIWMIFRGKKKSCFSKWTKFFMIDVH